MILQLENKIKESTYYILIKRLLKPKHTKETNYKAKQHNLQDYAKHESKHLPNKA